MESLMQRKLNNQAAKYAATSNEPA